MNFSNLMFLLIVIFINKSAVIYIIYKIMKIKEYLIENKEKVALGLLGLVAAGGLIYWLTKKPKEEEKPPITPNVLSQSKVSATSTAVHNQDHSQSEDEESKKMTKTISQILLLLQKNNDQITPEVISAIIHGQYSLSNEQIKKAIFRSRKQRRAKIEDHLQYAKIVTKHQLQLQQLQQKYLGTILARFNIDKVSWKQANDAWVPQGQGQDGGISDLIRNEEQQQLLSLRNPNKKPIDIDKILEVLQFKIDTLQKLNIEDLGFTLGADEAARYDLIEIYMSDLIFKKFKLEPEDLQFSIEQLSKENKQKVIESQQRVVDLMNMLIEIDQQDKKPDHL